ALCRRPRRRACGDAGACAGAAGAAAATGRLTAPSFSVSRSRPAALLELLAAAARAGVVAPGLGAVDDGLHARAQAVPDAVQVVDGPDGFAEDLQPLLAGAGRAVLVVHAQHGLALVVLGQGLDGLQRVGDPTGRF